MKMWRGHWLIFCCLLLLYYSCAKEYSYEGGASGAGFLVKDNTNNCSQVTVAGIYRIGNNLTDSNFLEVQVHVGRPGGYSISSTEENGYSFAATDNFTDTGIVSVKLHGKGKPLTAGTNLFTIKYESSVCEVKVMVEDTIVIPIVTTNPDHFPLTDGSHWSYDDLTFPGNSIIRTLNGTSVQNGSAHVLMDEYESFYPATFEQYYKRTGDDYFRYTSVSGFTSALNFSPSIYDEFNFLKENITTGITWYSNTYTGRSSVDVQVFVLRYYFQCLDANSTITVNGITFSQVYKIQMTPELAQQGFTPVPTGEVHTLYYAKGIGLVYQQFFNNVKLHDVMKIRSWVVN
jgi:hypothetical protein